MCPWPLEQATGAPLTPAMCVISGGYKAKKRAETTLPWISKSAEMMIA